MTTETLADKPDIMTTEQPRASSSDTTSRKTTAGPTHERSDVTWAENNDDQLLRLSRAMPITEIQKFHFSSFSVSQIKDILAQAQTRLRNRMIDAKEFLPNGATGSDDDENDEVIDTGFAARRGYKPVWEGTTSEWESKSKPGIGWLPEDERPDMEDFLRTHGKPLTK